MAVAKHCSYHHNIQATTLHDLENSQCVSLRCHPHSRAWADIYGAQVRQGNCGSQWPWKQCPVASQGYLGAAKRVFQWVMFSVSFLVKADQGKRAEAGSAGPKCACCEGGCSSSPKVPSSMQTHMETLCAGSQGREFTPHAVGRKATETF